MLYATEAIGIRGLLVHVLSDAAKAFYLRLGLESSPLDPMTMMATLAALRAALPDGAPEWGAWHTAIRARDDDGHAFGL